MGFPFHISITKMPNSINVSFLLNLLSQFKFIIVVALTQFGLFNTITPHQEDNTDEQNPASYVVLVGWSLVSIPAHIVTATIKKRLPVVKYRDLHEKEEEGEVCTVCLSCIERSHDVRELSNCCHVFHRDCLDNWVDVGQVTCPLCRSKLLPDDGGCVTDPWTVERNAYLFGEDHATTAPS